MVSVRTGRVLPCLSSVKSLGDMARLVLVTGDSKPALIQTLGSEDGQGSWDVLPSVK